MKIYIVTEYDIDSGADILHGDVKGVFTDKELALKYVRDFKEKSNTTLMEYGVFGFDVDKPDLGPLDFEAFYI